MKVADIMTADVAACRPDTKLPEIARSMCDNDCGAIPILDDQRRPIGVVTDRDIACRAVALGGDIANVEAREIMSRPVVTVAGNTDLDECRQLMEGHQLRRILVVDRAGTCCGIVAQADITQAVSRKEAGKVVREVSKSHAPRQVPASV
jgi:CBS domain-containing protein